MQSGRPDDLIPGGGALFFCGIGGSGMMPLARIAAASGFTVQGSDRSRDQGALPEKFAALEKAGMTLFPQDGSGVSAAATQAVIASTAVEDTIPDIAAARTAGVPVVHRAALLARFFNAAETPVAVAGTSGKTTVTGMLGFLLAESGLAPTVMTGGIFRNYAGRDPYCNALTGQGDVFVAEADESDGSIAGYRPEVGILHNIALDHKTLPELEALFRAYLGRCGRAVLNADHPGVMALKDSANKALTYGLTGGDLRAAQVRETKDGIAADVTYAGQSAQLALRLPGRHNLSNALAALAAGLALGLELAPACAILGRFEGIKRRMERVGTRGGIAVYDDFAHNPDKIAASLAAFRGMVGAQREGRLIVFFQPHGYGFLKLTLTDLARSFAAGLAAQDWLYLIEPFYAGGTVDRSVGSADLVAALATDLKERVQLCESREAAGQAMLGGARPGDILVVMGARDDTLSAFAQSLYDALPAGA